MRAVRTVMAGFAVTAMVVVAATSVNSLRAQDELAAAGSWERVCCGPQCSINGEQMDYCTGNGSYTCCKQ